MEIKEVKRVCFETFIKETGWTVLSRPQGVNWVVWIAQLDHPDQKRIEGVGPTERFAVEYLAEKLSGRWVMAKEENHASYKGTLGFMPPSAHKHQLPFFGDVWEGE